MKGRRGSGVALLITGALAVCWLFFAPPQLGGSTIYSSTVGNSMEPLFHKGDLALVRPAAGYQVHDVVLYESPILHRPVLHRIIAIGNGHYFFKGDHNDFVDPGYATRSELLGKLWLHVPKAGKALSFVGSPSHAGMLAGLAALVIVLGGAGRARRRRRRAHGAESPVKAAIRHIHKPRHPFEEIATLALLAATALALAVGFSTPAKKTAPLANAYRQDGSFSYTAPVAHQTDAVPGGVITTGQPVFLGEAKTVRLVFRYHFSSRFSHGIRGTIALEGRLSSSSSNWHRRFVFAKPLPFRGDGATVETTIQLEPLVHLLNSLAIAEGSPADSYNAVLEPSVHVHGYVDGKPVSATFAPTLPFVLTKALIKLDVQPSGPMPGVTTAPLSAADATAAALAPTASGSIPGVGPNTVAGAHVSVVDLRGLGIGLTGMLALVLLTRPMRRHRQQLSPEERRASDAGCIIVDVVSLTGSTAFTGSPVEVPDFASLVGFARYLERPILRDIESGAFAAEDGGRLYVYVPTPNPLPSPEPRPHGAPAPTHPSPRRRRRSLRWVGAALCLAVAAGVTATFTAANTVPLSNAGVSAFPVTPDELAPSECAGISLAGVVVATTATTTGTSGNDLILGRSGAGTFTLTGHGGSDCIVAGGGVGTTNTINGSGGGDVCIGAPGAKNKFTNCQRTY